MTPIWITADKFSEMTGLNREYILTCCRKGQWKENVAWRKLSDRIYLISIKWWNQWQETEAASKLRPQARLRSSFNFSESDAGKESNASPRLPTLDD